MSSGWVHVLFNVGNMAILPLWLLLVFFPQTRLASRVFYKGFVLLPLAVLYAVVVLPALIENPDFVGALLKPTLPGVQMLLSNESGAAAGWIHYLCFDLFVALEIRKRAIKRGHTFWWVSPIFVLILMLGPLGWLLFELISQVVTGLKPRDSNVRSTIN